MPRWATRWADGRRWSAALRLTACATALGWGAACAGLQPAVEREQGGGVELGDDPTIRIALATPAVATFGADEAWRLTDQRGSVVVRGARGERWQVERRDRRLRAVRVDGVATAWAEGPLVARTVSREGKLGYGGKRYRGELVLSATDSGVLVVNRLPVEEYLAGVVPLEIGDRPASDRAAAEAQAVAARSYTYARLRSSAAQSYDMRPVVADQVYGGADAERLVTTQAVQSTAGLVLLHAGRLVNAPYHSTCGGSTAAPPEVWRARAEPHLRAVSDRVPGTADRYYCDAAPRFAWTRTLQEEELRRLLDRYMSAYAAVPAGGVGAVRDLLVEETTPSGRVGWLRVTTARGVYRLRGNDIRSVLRSAGGEILNSTYFTVRRPPVARGESRAIATIDGRGYGHGIGMCQWGAIGRARAGQDFRTILRTYYPGTSVGYAR